MHNPVDDLAYAEIPSEQARPLIETPLTVEKINRASTVIMDVQDRLARLPLLGRIDWMELMLNATPAGLQRRLAGKKAVQAAQYLGEHNRACIAHWRAHGITALDFLDPSDPDSLRNLPIMGPDYFHRYAPQDRFYGDPDEAVLLASSGTMGRPKYFLRSEAGMLQALPAMRQFLRSTWEIDRYDRVDIVVSIPEPEPGQPQWGAGYHMMQLLATIAHDSPRITYSHISHVPEAAAYIEKVTQAPAGRTLVAIYGYPPDAVSVIQELTGRGRSFECPPKVDFKFSFTGEAVPPYKLFQMATWLRLIDEGLVERPIADLLGRRRGREQLRTLVKTFSTGLGSAEIQTGLSSSLSTVLWNVVMYLLERNEPDRVTAFLADHFEGRAFPWTAIKANPNVFFLLGRADPAGRVTLAPPPPGRHAGTAFATSLTGQVVNCQLDYMHIWDMQELAAHLRQKSGFDIKRAARLLGVRYGAGDMILTNGRMDNVGQAGLDAAVSWRTLRIYGHDLQTVAAQFPGRLSGMFTAQNLDYPDGTRTVWIHFEAGPNENVERLRETIPQEVVRMLGSMNPEFRHLREVMLRDGGEERFKREVQIRLLPHGHPRFQRDPGQVKHRYIYRPRQIEGKMTRLQDPIAEIFVR